MSKIFIIEKPWNCPFNKEQQCQHLMSTNFYCVDEFPKLCPLPENNEDIEEEKEVI